MAGVGERPAVVSCRFEVIPVKVETGKTVRAPAGPSANDAVGACAVGSCARIFSESAVMLWVVKTLAPAISPGCTPETSAAGSASSSFLRYAFTAGSFVCPKLRS